MAMNNEIAELPRPYPFVRSSSSIKTITPANVNYRIIKIAFPAPT